VSEGHWTQGPARWAAAVLLGLAGVGGMAWSVLGERSPIRERGVEGVAGPRGSVGSVGSGLERGWGGIDPLWHGPPAGDPGWGESLELYMVAGPVENRPHQGQPHQGRPQRDREPAPTRMIDVNSASVAELQLLPGIGPTLARRIAADRAANGPFASLEDLGRVPGIGPLTVERISVLAEARGPDRTR
jgi:competence ComEA-like helix-hairpin-helix protein